VSQRLRLVSLGWRRVQVLLAVAHQPRPAPETLRLRRHGTNVLAHPTGWSIEGDTLVLRFNVFQGPHQEPLDRGRWTLVSATSGRRPTITGVTIDSAPIVPPTARAEFVVATDSLYIATASVDSASGRFHLDIEVLDLESRVPIDPRQRYGTGTVGRAVHMLLRPRLAVFTLLFRLFRIVARRNGRRILFSSDSRAALGGNLRLVFDRMVERGLDREYELQTLFKDGIVSSRALRDRFRLPWLLARADAIVIDDYHPVIYRLQEPHVRIVQLWHAVGAFKTVGYSRVGRPGAPNPYGIVHKNYSHAIVSSIEDVPVYAEAYGIPESRVFPTGVPRVDLFFDPGYRERALAQVETAIPARNGRFTMLFAPTFRGDGARTATFDFGKLDLATLHALCVEKDARCLVKMHPFVRERLEIPPEFCDRIIDLSDSPIDVNDLLFAVDLLITDYSSIVFEYSTLGRPMLFYAYDLEEYIASRDFYEPYEAFVPGRIVRTFDELVDAIRRADYQQDRVEAFARRHFDHLDGGSTDRVIDLITAALAEGPR